MKNQTDALSSTKPYNGRETVACAIVSFNEESNIQSCLESAKWMDEIILVDSFSTDRTTEIAQAYTNRIFQHPWKGFGEQKNFAIEQATRHWVFILDADERITPELRDEIENTLVSYTPNGPVAFSVPRRNMFYGEWVRWGGAYPDLQIRLFQKGKAIYNDVEIHENLIVEGPIGNLKGHLEHYTERRIVDHFRKFSLYITLAAKEQAKSTAKVHWWNLQLNPLVTFIKKYCLKQGFRDGIRGIIYAGFASMYTFGKYAKLFELRCSSNNI
jgi:glycosyltransferase involved in cell wall biosynthesis